MMDDGTIELKYCLTSCMIADMLTKGLSSVWVGQPVYVDKVLKRFGKTGTKQELFRCQVNSQPSEKECWHNCMYFALVMIIV